MLGRKDFTRDEIDEMDKTALGSQLYSGWQHRYQWFLAAGLLLQWLGRTPAGLGVGGNRGRPDPTSGRRLLECGVTLPAQIHRRARSLLFSRQASFRPTLFKFSPLTMITVSASSSLDFTGSGPK